MKGKKIKNYKELIIQYLPHYVGRAVKSLKVEMGEEEWYSLPEQERVSLIIDSLENNDWSLKTETN